MLLFWILMAPSVLALAFFGFLGCLSWWRGRQFKMRFKPRATMTPLERFLF